MGAVLHGIDVPERGRRHPLRRHVRRLRRACPPTCASGSTPSTSSHTFEHTFGAFLDDEQTAKMLAQPIPPPTHPMACTHDVTGRKHLYVNRNFASHVVGMDRDESAELIDLHLPPGRLPRVPVPLPLGAALRGVLGQPGRPALRLQRLLAPGPGHGASLDHRHAAPTADPAAVGRLAVQPGCQDRSPQGAEGVDQVAGAGPLAVGGHQGLGRLAHLLLGGRDDRRSAQLQGGGQLLDRSGQIARRCDHPVQQAPLRGFGRRDPPARQDQLGGPGCGPAPGPDGARRSTPGGCPARPRAARTTHRRWPPADRSTAPARTRRPRTGPARRRSSRPASTRRPRPWPAPSSGVLTERPDGVRQLAEVEARRERPTLAADDHHGRRRSRRATRAATASSCRAVEPIGLSRSGWAEREPSEARRRRRRSGSRTRAAPDRSSRRSCPNRPRARRR